MCLFGYKLYKCLGMYKVIPSENWEKEFQISGKFCCNYVKRILIDICAIL